MSSSDLLNSKPPMRYPRAAKWLKEQAARYKLDQVYRLDLIEEVSESRDFSDYCDLRSEWACRIPLRETLLYKDWMNGKDIKSNISVYAGRFEIGQHISYFRDCFREFNEEETRNSKGEVIELKAYGQSTKMKRQVVVFEGRFVNGFLASYKDKTDSAWDYLKDGPKTDSDFMENDMALLKVLFEHDCFEVLHEVTLITILADIGKIDWLLKKKTLDDATRTFAEDLKKEHLQRENEALQEQRNARLQAKEEALRLQAKEDAHRSKARSRRLILFTAIALLLVSLYFYSRRDNQSANTGSVKASVPDSSLSPLLLDTLSDGTTIFISPGSYTVETTSKNGVPLYADSLRRKRLRAKAAVGSTILIERVEGEMGFFRSSAGADKLKTGEWWIDMRHLVPE